MHPSIWGPSYDTKLLISVRNTEVLHINFQIFTSTTHHISDFIKPQTSVYCCSNKYCLQNLKLRSTVAHTSIACKKKSVHVLLTIVCWRKIFHRYSERYFWEILSVIAKNYFLVHCCQFCLFYSTLVKQFYEQKQLDLPTAAYLRVFSICLISVWPYKIAL